MNFSATELYQVLETDAKIFIAIFLVIFCRSQQSVDNMNFGNLKFGSPHQQKQQNETSSKSAASEYNGNEPRAAEGARSSELQ